MPTIYVISVTLHVLAAMLWVGGMGFFALVVVPAARNSLERSAPARCCRQWGSRPGRVHAPPCSAARLLVCRSSS
jgi:hypothetical protein